MKYNEPKLNLLTDHIGMFERSVPTQRWRAIASLMLALIVLVTGAWEIKMRSLGLRTADIDDGKTHWTAERRKVAAGRRDQVVLVGDSRLLFDTNLDVWQQVAGIRPIQLALPGTNARPFLEELANDPRFAGLVVLGFNETLFFSNMVGRRGEVLSYWRRESPSQRSGHQLYVLLSRALAFLDSEYGLLSLLNKMRLPNRTGVEDKVDVGMTWYGGVWKLSESQADRQTTLWPRIETDMALRQHALYAWSRRFELATRHQESRPDALIRSVIAATQRDVDKIRRRGGEVVLVLPPSSGPWLEHARRLVPRERAWDALVRDTATLGIHFEDYPQTRQLMPAEWSHLNGEDAKTFTHAYVSVLCQKLEWLKMHGAPCASSDYSGRP